MTFVYEGAVSTGEVGGARVHFAGMAQALDAQLGSELRVITPSFRGEAGLAIDLPNSASHRRLPALGPGLLGHVSYELVKCGYLVGLRLRDLVRRRRTTVMSRITPVGIAPVVTRAFGVHTVIEVNGIPDAEFESRGFSGVVVRSVRFVTSLQLRVADRVVAVTDGTAKVCRRRTSAPVTRIENGVDLESIPAARALEHSGDPATVAYSGAFAPWQDLSTLIRSIARLRIDDPDRGWRLILIGDGERRQELEFLVAELGIHDAVEFTGWLDREAAAERLLEARVAVVPLLPKFESGLCGSPLKLFEYLAAGRSVVGSDVDGVVELVDYPIELYVRADVDDAVRAIRIAADRTVTAETLDELRERTSWTDRCERVLAFAGTWGTAQPDAST